jgi:hypothetical protein
MTKREDKLSDFSKILTDRTTVIRFRDPIDAGAIGETMRWDNIAVIDISPHLTDQDKFHVWLHELAHVKFHFNQLKSDNQAILYLQPRSSNLAASIRTGEVEVNQPRENTADQQATIWQQDLRIREFWNITRNWS